MRTTKNWGFVNSRAELYMMSHAERHRKQLEKKHKKKPTRENVPIKIVQK